MSDTAKCGQELVEEQTAMWTDFRRCTLPSGHKGKHSDGRKSWIGVGS